MSSERSVEIGQRPPAAPSAATWFVRLLWAAGIYAISLWLWTGLLLLRHGPQVADLGFHYRAVGDRVEVAWVDPAGPAAGRLEAGDRILAVDGRKVLGRRTYLALRPLLARGDPPVPVDVVRGGKLLRVDFAPAPAGLRGALAGHVGTALAGLVLLALGLFVGAARPTDAAARRFCLAAVTGSLFFLGWLYAAVGDLLTAPENWAGVAIRLLHPLEFALAFDLYARFPVDSHPRSLWRRLAPVFYAWGGLLALGRAVVGVAALQGPAAAYEFAVAHQRPLALSTTLFNAFLAISCLAIAAAVLRPAGDGATLDQLRKVRWIRFGAALAFLPWIVADTLPQYVALPGRWEDLLDRFAILATLAIPATVAYAIVRHRVFGIAVVVRKSVGYLLARNSLRLLVALPVAALLVRLLRSPDLTLGELLVGSPAMPLLALAALAGLAVRDPLQRWIDRRFFRDRYRRDQIVLGLLESLPTIDTESGVGREAGSRLEAALHPTTLQVFLRATDGGALVANAGTGTLVGDLRALANADLLSRLESVPGAIDLSAPPDSALPEEARATLAALDARLLVPIRAPQLGLLGALVLGEKRSEEPYSREDRELLEGVAAQTGLALENLRLAAQVSRATSERRRTLDRIAGAGRALLRECPACGRCFDAGERCPDDGAELEVLAPIDRLLHGRYRLDRRLGRGGMGSVYAAHDLRLGRDVAVKVLVGRLFGRTDALRRFRREARVAARLDHDNLVRIYDSGELGDGAYLVMELVRGPSLRDVLRARGTVPPELAAEWMRQLLAGLGAAHSAGIVHRDLKPDNVLCVGEDPAAYRIKITDFGLGKWREGAEGESGTITEAGAPLGTPAYMAPEQFQGRADERTDLFSAGLLAVELVSGNNPFAGGGLFDVARAIAERDVRIDGEAAALRTLDRCLSRCLAKDPAQRPASADALASDLVPALAGCAGLDVRVVPVG